MTQTALITGVTGQDGGYLAEFLLKKGYTVYGLARDHADINPQVKVEQCDLKDGDKLKEIIKKLKPDEIYNLGSQSHVSKSFEEPEYTSDVTAIAALRILEAVRKYSPNTKVYQAGSSEMFGLVKESPQKETTPFHPRSPYGVAKVYAYWIARNYREAYNLFACNGLLFNHESPRRRENFVTKKITQAAARIKLGKQEKLYLGNLEAKRDWGYAPDYIEAMWLMLQQQKPDDYVIATGETHSVKEFCEEAFKHAQIPITWEGTGKNTKGKNNGKTIIEIDPKYFRPAEIDYIQGDSSYAQKKLGWKPTVSFKELVRIMVDADMAQESLKTNT